MDLKAVSELLTSNIGMPNPQHYRSVTPRYAELTISDFLLENPSYRTDARDIAANSCNTLIKDLCHQNDTEGETDLVNQGIVSKQVEQSLLKWFYEERCCECSQPKPDHHHDYWCGQIQDLYDRRLDVLTACLEEPIYDGQEIKILEIKPLNIAWYNLYNDLINKEVECYIFNDQVYTIINNQKFSLRNIIDVCSIEDHRIKYISGDFYVVLHIKLNDETVLHRPDLKNVMVNHSMGFIHDYLDDYDLDMSISYQREITEYLEKTPLSLVSLACWQAKNTYLRAVDEGCFKKLVRNFTKSTLRKKLKFYSTDHTTIDKEKYVDYVDINDDLIDFLDDVVPSNYSIADVKCMSPIEFQETYSASG